MRRANKTADISDGWYALASAGVVGGDGKRQHGWETDPVATGFGFGSDRRVDRDKQLGRR
jgi:hypothetical protein